MGKPDGLRRPTLYPAELRALTTTLAPWALYTPARELPAPGRWSPPPGVHDISIEMSVRRCLRLGAPRCHRSAAEAATAQGEDGVGAGDGPTHAGALELGADLLASGLDDARGDAQAPGGGTRAPRVAGDALDSAGEIAPIRKAVGALDLDALEAWSGLNDAIARSAALPSGACQARARPAALLPEARFPPAGPSVLARRRGRGAVARPLGKDPNTEPIIDARLVDGSRVAICGPPAAPTAAITIRRFGGRAFTVEELTASGSLPAAVVDEAAAVLGCERNLLISGGTGSGKTTLLNALVSLLPADGRIISIEDTLALRLRRANCLRRDDPRLGAARAANLGRQFANAVSPMSGSTRQATSDIRQAVDRFGRRG